jgi:hypothetical protein
MRGSACAIWAVDCHVWLRSLRRERRAIAAVSGGCKHKVFATALVSCGAVFCAWHGEAPPTALCSCVTTLVAAHSRWQSVPGCREMGVLPLSCRLDVQPLLAPRVSGGAVTLRGVSRQCAGLCAVRMYERPGSDLPVSWCVPAQGPIRYSTTWLEVSCMQASFVHVHVHGHV